MKNTAHSPQLVVITNKLNKLKFLCLLLCLQFNLNTFASGESCTQAYSVIPDTLPIQHNYMVTNSDKSVWFSFTATASEMEIYSYESATNPGTVATEIHAYSGSCSAYSEIFTNMIDYTRYGQRNLILKNLTLNTNYYVKFIAAKSNANLSISFSNYSASSAPCSIVTNLPPFTSNSNLVSIAPNSRVFVAANVILTLGGNITIDNCKFEMGQGSSIVAPNGVHIKNGSRFYGCTGLWQGIEVANGDITVEKDVMISDAQVGLNISTNGQIIIHEALFNRNNRGITISSSGFNASSLPVHDVIFTSRYFALPYTAANLTIVHLKNINPATGKPYLEDYAPIGLLNTNINRPFAGICDFHSFAGTLQIGQFPIGTKDNNIFDNLDYGIISSLTNTTCINNVFQFMSKGSSSTNLFPYYNSGVGIVADAQINTSGLATPFTINVGAANANFAQNSNTFYNCFQGVVSNYSNMSIKYNTFDCDGLFNQAQQMALFTYPGSGGNLQFEHNVIKSMSFGLRLIAGAANFSYSNFSFSYNDFDLLGINNSMFGSNAMTIQGISITNTSAIAKINHNTIQNVKGGINISNNGFSGAKSEISGNTIAILGASSGSTTPGSGAGILLNSTTRCNLTENTITGDYTSGAANKYCVGINLVNSKNCHLQCNNVSNVSTGFLFDGNCTAGKSYVFTHNSMSNCKDGLVLANSLGGIGKNGAANAPSDNSWSGFFDRSQTMADNANFNFTIGGTLASHFYCRAGAGSTPILNLDFNGINANALDPDIATGIYQVVCNDINNELLEGNDPTDVFKELIINAEEYPVLEDENEWLNKKYAYEQLMFDSTYTTLNDPELNDFIDSMQYENIALFSWIEQLIAQNDYYYAQFVNNGLTPQNLIEQNIQVFNEYYLLWCENPFREFSASEISDLMAVANQCQNVGGLAVLQSRILLECILGEALTWNSFCPIPASSLRKSKASSKKSFVRPLVTSLSIGPIPATTCLTVKTTNFSLPIKYVISDSNGKKIIESELIKSESTIDISKMADGIYFFSSISSNGNAIHKKIIVNRK
ncbi:MAG TPA: T9SS type A sorting domain-containing protein [Bacteroidia bacterium]|nr:T9SS type A sorting domain-containing protein [Bacteroidia bacterium]HRH08717.1 T9SS type A sorting domain-containing protein [Bacteroidia bacterium]HRH62821.1 T9SS type A sorting domain-containing protein [Bacteroidia bacterium]